MAEAISFRYGSTQDHRNFHGVKGEITVDTEAHTAWIHTGDNAIGKPLARADLENVEQNTIANKGIAKADLSNVVITDSSSVRNRFNVLNYADRNLNNVEISDLEAKLDDIYVQEDLSNLNKSVLVDKIDDTFVTTDLSNLSDATIIAKGLAKSNLTNVEASTIKSKGIASNTLDNVTLSDTIRDSKHLDLQKVSNLVSINDAAILDNGTYPSAYSVKNAIDAIPPMITNMVVDTFDSSETYGQITITVSKTLSLTPAIKAINGQLIDGTWTNSSNTWIFTPADAATAISIVTTSWIINIA